ncbi:MAG: lipid A oxidase [Hyphomicrobiaceae bacterium]|nr:lipid A oxidase [Hyphomicrobiaceae bacterium]
MTISITADDRELHVTPQSLLASLEKLSAIAAIVLLATIMLASGADDADLTQDGAGNNATRSSGTEWQNASETVASGYVGAPYYYRSDFKLKRPNGTDMTLKRMGWDGDAFYFPIDGGARVIHWTGSVGYMIDFMHNKAIARLGKGAHGRKIKNGVVEDVETTGTLNGKPAPSPLHLTDLFDRMEFTHGHNVLLLSGLVRFAPITAKIRPYLGIGFGASVPHVEAWFTGEALDRRTNEYQYAGPAFQILAGLELRNGRGSFYLEYKYIWSSIEAALTGGKSWSLKDLKSDWLPRWFLEPFSGLTEMPGDLWRQFTRWRSGEAPPEGNFATTLSSHQIVIGGGYVWPGRATAGAGAVQP